MAVESHSQSESEFSLFLDNILYIVEKSFNHADLVKL